MSKIFRPYDVQGSNDKAGWFDSNAYGSNAISDIKDPDGGTPLKDITSIPSPFARMDLIVTALHEINNAISRQSSNRQLPVNKLKELLTFDNYQRPTMYHRLVSEMFDVAEIFFNIKNLSDRFEIIVWDRADIDLDNPFGRTVKRFLDADASAYNFGTMKRLYLLNYIGPESTGPMNIVGATSPVTMFFPTANDMSYIANYVAFGNDRPFDHECNPLFKRDFDFIKYFFTFKAANPQFPELFKELDTYLEYTRKVLSEEQKKELREIKPNSIEKYEDNEIKFGKEKSDHEESDHVEILGMPIHTKLISTNWESDFYIQSSIYNEEKKPMVLPVENGNIYANWKYTTDCWGTERRAKYKCSTKWDSRTLPDANVGYPYLTISDFLEDTIIRMPSELNNERFYGGGYSCENKPQDEEDSFLLPLTDTFFSFFSTKELVDNDMLQIKEIVGGVKVVLKIPVKKGTIKYSRVYFDGIKPDAETNEGSIIELNFGLGIMPLIRFPENIKKHYRVAYFNKSVKDSSLTFLDGSSDIPLASKHVVRTDAIDRWGNTHESYSLDSNFDRIKVRLSNTSGTIVPKFIDKQEANSFTFAVDFGTTNTHIEYCTNNNPNPRPFCIEEEKIHLHRLHSKSIWQDINKSFVQDLIPETIGSKTDKFSFPIRTALAEKIGIMYDSNPIPLCDVNIPFLYEYEPTPDWNTVKTELKWSGSGGDDDKRLTLYIENLCILLRNKVLMGDGCLDKTTIIWFYPASMISGKVTKFSEKWKKAYEEYFGSAEIMKDDQGITPKVPKLISISESKAPVLNFQDAPSNVVTIDIGGGTTDVFVVEDGKDKMLMSFRYASNAIFGDAYGSSFEKNGFRVRYLDEIIKVLRANGKDELQRALMQIESQKKSTDVIAFFFSLVGDKVDNNKALDFLQKLSYDDQMRYVFIIFYGSLFYFVAKVLKSNNVKKPQAICFSGNGSRTIDVLSTNDNTIGSFAKMIFDDVYGTTTGIIKIEREKNPKTATCKGGIKAVMNNTRYDYDEKIKTVVIGDDLDKAYNVIDVEQDNKIKNYSQIDEHVIKNVTNSVEQFLVTIFRLNDKNNGFFRNEFCADPRILRNVKDFCLGEEGKQVLEDSIKKGVRDKKERDGISDNEILEETLFFYPLVGLLHDLACKISGNQTKEVTK